MKDFVRLSVTKSQNPEYYAGFSFASEILITEGRTGYQFLTEMLEIKLAARSFEIGVTDALKCFDRLFSEWNAKPKDWLAGGCL